MTSVLDRLPDESRVAILRFRSLGDCVLTTPAAAILKRALKEQLLVGIFSGIVIGITTGVIAAIFNYSNHGVMLGLSYVTRYAGMDATLGVAFAATGVLYPFFAAILGWLGVFLTGTDAGSNALFGSLQKITATEVYKSGVLSHLTLAQSQVQFVAGPDLGGDHQPAQVGEGLGGHVHPGGAGDLMRHSGR